MTFRLDFVKLTCLDAGADFSSGDDTYLSFSNSFASGKAISGGFGLVFNTNPARQGTAAFGNHAMDVGDVGFFVGLLGGTPPITFNNSLTISVKDFDSGEFPELFDISDDLIGSSTFTSKASDPIGGQFELIRNISGSGSSYQIDFGVTKISKDVGTGAGRLATNAGGVLNGKNTDGTLIGLGGKDEIYANDGDDILSDGANNDILVGGQGNDLLIGGKSNDRLTGSAGSDTFVVAPKSGLDTITDFRDGQDLIGLGGGLKFADLSIVKSASGTLIKAGNEQLALLQGVKPVQISAADFIQMDSPYLSSLLNSTMAALRAA